MEFNRWWWDKPEERYWLEITDRKDVGVDLRAPQAGRDGHEIWHYSLVAEVQPGDVVFHYTRGADSSPGISAWSRAVGRAWPESIVWAPHAGESTAELRAEPGWRLALEGPFPLTKPVSLERIRGQGVSIRTIEEQLVEMHGHPTYHPFETGRRETRAAPAYLTKLPRDMVLLFDELARVETDDHRLWQSDSGACGSPYRRVNESALLSERDPFDTDPALVERGLRAHAQTQNELADFLNWHGIEPLSPQSHEPQYDLAFTTRDGLSVVEVKCLTPYNQERQLRLGLGQVLRYADILTSPDRTVTPVVAVEHEPPADWLTLLERLDVRVGWPGQWIRLLHSG